MASWKKIITDGLTLSDIGTPASDDKVLIQDTDDSNTIKYVDFGDIGGSSGSTTINNNADNLIITGSGTANTLNAESNLTYSTDLQITGGKIILGTNNKSIDGQLTAGVARPMLTMDTSDVVVVGNASSDAVKLQGNTELAGNISFDSSDHNKFSCKPSMEVVLDDDDDTAAASTSFKITDNSSADIFKVRADGVSEGMFTTDAPTATFPTTAQAGATMTGTIDNHIATADYVGKVFNASGTEQSTAVTIDSSGNISMSAPSSAAQNYELRIFCADVGELRSQVLTKTFNVTAATNFRIWRTQFVDSSGNASTNKAALVELEYYPNSNAGGTHEPDGNANSNTSIGGVTISSGYTHSSTYAPWKAFDGTTGAAAGSMWWSLSISTAADNWIQVQFGSAQSFQSAKLHIYGQFNDATHFKILGSNNGTDFTTVLDTTAIVESGNDTAITHNF